MFEVPKELLDAHDAFVRQIAETCESWPQAIDVMHSLNDHRPYHDLCSGAYAVNQAEWFVARNRYLESAGRLPLPPEEVEVMLERLSLNLRVDENCEAIEVWVDGSAVALASEWKKPFCRHLPASKVAKVQTIADLIELVEHAPYELNHPHYKYVVHRNSPLFDHGDVRIKHVAELVNSYADWS